MPPAPRWGVLCVVSNQGAVVAIIDDDEGVRDSLVSLVRSLGHETLSYPSAGAFLAAPGPDPACLITDVQMPGMTGDQLQAALLAGGRTIPMIFVTAFHVDAIRERVMGAGGVAYLIKPVNCDAIERNLAKALQPLV